MPEQHQELFAQLPYFFVGLADARGQPWATMLRGPPGFIRASSPTELNIVSAPDVWDPALSGWTNGARIGGLGIQLHSRRRNRVNGTLWLGTNPIGARLAVEQSFGNCAQYINARHASGESASLATTKADVLSIDRWDGVAAQILDRADTFFIATQRNESDLAPRGGLDVSHRGGPPGFIRRVNERTVQWPDYRGNFFFNTLGNLELDKRCGILVVDFLTGDLLQATGEATVDWDGGEHQEGFPPVQRTLTFVMSHALITKGGRRLRWSEAIKAPQFGSS